MGRKGPKPKHPNLRQSHKEPVGRVLEVVRDASLDVPLAPSGMLKKQRDEWSAFWDTDVSKAVDVSDMPALSRLFELKDQWERCRRVVKKQPLIEGSQHQLVENPLSKRMDRLSLEIRQLEDRFGLSPSSRARLGLAALTVGDKVSSANRDWAALVE